MTTPPPPEEATPVIEAIRRDVPRPDDLPVSARNDGMFLDFERGETCRCPMGLLPNVTSAKPYITDDFTNYEFAQVEIIAFYEWWDKLTDPQAAVDAVWGPGRKMEDI